MDNLTPFHALGGVKPKREQINGIVLEELPEIALISMALRQASPAARAALLQQLHHICGVDVPNPGRANIKADHALMWLGVDQFLYELPYSQGQQAEQELQTSLGGAVSFTDQSDAWVVLSLSGAHSISVLERLVMLDVESMTAGSFARTTLDHSGVLIRCVVPQQEFRVYAIRSYARSVYHALHTALSSCPPFKAS